MAQILAEFSFLGLRTKFSSARIDVITKVIDEKSTWSLRFVAPPAVKATLAGRVHRNRRASSR